MASSKPLVPGGIVNKKRYGFDGNPPFSFHTNTPPNIDKDTMIVAVASPNIRTGVDNWDGWFLSDFYAFNYLFKGLGHSQTWLTAADPEQYVYQYGDLLHGNDFQGRKVVLSWPLIKNKEYSPVTVVSPEAMVSRFVQEVRAASAEAARHDRPLLLMIFCHGIREHQFLLNTVDKDDTLSTLMLKEAIADRCRVTLLSTACHSGGWVQEDLKDPDHEPLNATMFAAASVDDTSLAWHISSSVNARTCGSIFASSVIEALTSAASPLLADTETGTQESSSGPSGSGAKQTSMQPDSPNEDQTLTFNEFCRSIIDACRGIHRFWDNQTFTFSAQNDQWDWSWPKRSGTPLADFEARWNALETIPYTGKAVEKQMWDPHPSNSSNTVPLPALTGGLTIEDKLEDQMIGNTDRMDHHLKVMARLFLQTCPGDWQRGQNVGLGTGLRLVSQGKKPPMDTDVGAVVSYRCHMAHMADLMVRVFKLPKPNNETCLMWHREDWERDARKRISNFADRKMHVWDKFTASVFEPRPTSAQGPPFTRFQQYMTAAVVEADLTPADTNVVVNDLVAYMATAKKAVQDATVKNDGTRRRGRDWIRSIGRAVRRSLSPRKSISGQSYRERSDTATSRRSRGGSSASLMDNMPTLSSPRASTDSQRPSLDLARRLSERKGKGTKK